MDALQLFINLFSQCSSAGRKSFYPHFMDGVLPDKMETKSKVTTVGCPSPTRFRNLRTLRVKNAADSDLSLGRVDVVQRTPRCAEEEETRAMRL